MGHVEWTYGGVALGLLRDPQATGPPWALVNLTVKHGQAARVDGLLFLS